MPTLGVHTGRRKTEKRKRCSACPQVGARWYRAPELLLGMQSCDAAVDMWAAGCCLAHMLLGRWVGGWGYGTMGGMDGLQAPQVTSPGLPGVVLQPRLATAHTRLDQACGYAPSIAPRCTAATAAHHAHSGRAGPGAQLCSLQPALHARVALSLYVKAG
jgi:hypothetical protein